MWSGLHGPRTFGRRPFVHRTASASKMSRVSCIDIRHRRVRGGTRHQMFLRLTLFVAHVGCLILSSGVSQQRRTTGAATSRMIRPRWLGAGALFRVGLEMSVEAIRGVSMVV